MKYDPATATFEDDGGPSFDPKPRAPYSESNKPTSNHLPKYDAHPHEIDRFVDDGGIATLELKDRFEQVLGD